MKELKKKSLKSVLWILILTAIGFIATLAVALPAALKLWGIGVKDLNDLDYAAEMEAGTLDGTYVKGTLTAVYDAYCEETTQYNTLTATEYIIDAGSDYFMGFRVLKKDMEPTETLLTATYGEDEAAFHAAAFQVQGTIHAMPEDSQEWYDDWFSYQDEQYQALAIPYYLELNIIGDEEISEVKHKADTYFAGAAVCLSIFVITLAVVLSGSRQKSIKEYIASSPNRELAAEKVEKFLSNNEYVNGLKYNAEFLTAQNGSKTIFCETSKIVWAYMKTITHKRNGITTGHTYSLILCFYNGKRAEIVMGSEEQVKTHLKNLGETFPHICIGYSDDLDKMYRKDLAKFLDLRYNPAMATAQAQAANDPFANI